LKYKKGRKEGRKEGTPKKEGRKEGTQKKEGRNPKKGRKEVSYTKRNSFNSPHNGGEQEDNRRPNNSPTIDRPSTNETMSRRRRINDTIGIRFPL
jgi:hypothetical protein